MVLGLFVLPVWAQVADYQPVTQSMLGNPRLMYSRTYDNQRFSPLDQINRGVLYVVNPGAVIQAWDATNGDLIWDYQRRLPRDLEDYISAADLCCSIKQIFGSGLFEGSSIASRNDHPQERSSG